MVWKTRRDPVSNRSGEILTVASGGRDLAVRDVIAGWRDDEAFRAFFVAELAATTYPAYFWEMPPVERATLSHPFECALIRGDALARMQADDTDFASHLNSGSASVTSFRNLGGDALLIVPRRMSDADCYGHIAAFARVAPPEQQHALFLLLAQKTLEMLEPRTRRFWISTSGLGVPWVHVRLDSYPKYYQHRPYQSDRTT
ncbi:MAG TPA: hypothetical protein VIM02_16230 [Rhizomicrobium sp.]